MVRPATWQRREYIIDPARSVAVGLGVSAEFPIDGIELGREIAARLSQGWALLTADTRSINLKSPEYAPTGSLISFPRIQAVYTSASYFIEG
jgi:hypothetical protein